MRRRTAGFLQKSNSFCAVASCCASTCTPPVAAAFAFASSLEEVVVKPDSLVGDAGPEPALLAVVVPWVMPVLRSTSAIDAMQHRFGSRARYPHVSSRSKPLQRDGENVGFLVEGNLDNGKGVKNAPHAEHVDQVLLGDVVVAADVSLQRRKDAPVLEQGVAAVNLELRQRRVRLAQLVSGGVSRVVGRRRCGPRCGCGCDSLFPRRRDCKVLEFLSQYDDGLLEEERVLHVGLGQGRAERQVSTGTVVAWSAVKGVAGRREKVEDKVEALGVELQGFPRCQ